MGKKLPSIFSNKIDKKLSNNEEYYVSNEKRNISLSKEEIMDKINKIFNSESFIYKAYVKIILKDKEIDKKIIGIKDNSLLTIDGDYIKIDDIVDIKIKD